MSNRSSDLENRVLAAFLSAKASSRRIKSPVWERAMKSAIRLEALQKELAGLVMDESTRVEVVEAFDRRWTEAAATVSAMLARVAAQGGEA